MKQNELEWFRPLWRRVAVVVFICGWLAVEVIWLRDQFWMVIVGAALAYAVWVFFIRFDKGTKPGGDDAQPKA